MRPKVVRGSLLTITGLLLTASATAVQLEAPEVIKTGWNSGSLVAADIDGDGRTDLAVINNDRARIELMIQRSPGSPAPTRPAGTERWQPILEDARFDRRGIPTGSRMYALDAGDLDGDDRVDLVYTGNPHGLVIRYQNRDGDFDREVVFDITEPAVLRGTVAARDVNADGRIDLAVLTKTELLLFRQTVEGDLDGPERWRLSAGSFALELVDVNGDQRVDISYQNSGSGDPLRIRHGLATGGFGPEVTYRMSPSHGVVRTLPAPGGRGRDFIRIQADTGLVEWLQFASPKTGKSILSNARPRVFTFPTNGHAPVSSTLGDLDGNGLLDLAVADPKGARIWLVQQEEPGVFAAAEEFPSLAGIGTLIAMDRDGDGRDELVMASPRERTLAWTHLTPDGALALPTIIDTQGKPIALAASDLDGDDHIDLVYASVEKRDRRVFLIPGISGWTEPAEIEVSALETDPEAVKVADLDGDGREDLVLFVNHDGLRLLRQNQEGGFDEVSPETGFGRSLVSEVEPSAWSTGDVTGDGSDEIIIANSGFARALRLDDAGEFEIVAQFNPKSSDSEIAAAAVLGSATSRDRSVVLLEPAADQLHIVTPRRGGVWRYLESLDLEVIDLIEARSVDLDGSGTDDLVLFGADRLVWLPVGIDDPVLKPVGVWECDLEGVNYQLVGVGDLNADDRYEVAAIDTRDSHVLEILRPGFDREWKSLLHFTVFEVDPHYEGQRGAVNQPREIVIADLTGDGLDDLVLVVHDRILLYPQSN